MSENISIKEVSMVAENEETVIKEILVEIIHDVILKFFFETHQAIKLEKSENFFTNNTHSKESIVRKRKWSDLSEPNMSRISKSIDKQDRRNQKKSTSAEMINGNELSIEASISTSNNKVNLPFVNLKEKSDCFKRSENEIMVSRTSTRLLSNGNSSFLNCNKHTPIWNHQESKAFRPVTNASFLKVHDTIENSVVLKLNNKHAELSEENMIELSLGSAEHTKSTENEEFQRSEKELKLEKNWIKEAYECTECTTAKSFQDWIQFISSAQAEESSTFNKDVHFMSDKEIKNDIGLVNEDRVEADIFGIPEMSLQKRIDKMICICSVCGRKIGAVRFAYHLSKCMNLGRRRNQRYYLNAKRNKR